MSPPTRMLPSRNTPTLHCCDVMPENVLPAMPFPGIRFPPRTELVHTYVTFSASIDAICRKRPTPAPAILTPSTPPLPSCFHTSSWPLREIPPPSFNSDGCPSTHDCDAIVLRSTSSVTSLDSAPPP